LKALKQDMTSTEFFAKYNLENTIILLEGKRNVIELDKEKLIKFGKFLATNLPKAKFRSGNADGISTLKGVLKWLPNAYRYYAL
jgi:hypothetical protein